MKPSQSNSQYKQSRKPDQAQPNPHNKRNEDQANQNKTTPKTTQTRAAPEAMA